MRLEELVVRFMLGGALITLVSLLGNTRWRILSGMAVLFPIVTLVGFYFLSLQLPISALREIVFFSALSVPTVLGFILGFYFALNYFPVTISLALGVLTWFAIAAGVLIIDANITQVVLG